MQSCGLPSCSKRKVHGNSVFAMQNYLTLIKYNALIDTLEIILRTNHAENHVAILIYIFPSIQTRSFMVTPNF